jgi:phytanoyl-CoA hydroxylase
MLRAEALTLDVAPVLEHFAEHGYARLGRVLTDEGIAALGERADDLMMGRLTYPGMFFQMDAVNGRYEDAPRGLGWQGPSRDYRKLEKLEMDPRFLEWIRNPLFERIARARIAGPVALYRCIIFNKSAAGSSDIPWHQDGGKLWGLSEDPHLQIWTALDDAPVGGGCLEVLPGSHAGGLVTALGGVVPKEKVEAADAEQRAVALPAVAGESILVHNTLWHRSGKTVLGQRRLGLSICYMTAATRCLRTKRAPRQFFTAFP